MRIIGSRDCWWICLFCAKRKDCSSAPPAIVWGSLRLLDE
jgi:hypothetical protein